MQYRKMGKLDEQVSALGFGCMRFPTLGSYSEIDEEKSAEMLTYAMDKGVNYIDTAWPYHQGASEPFVGKVLADGYRDKVHLATKLPIWMIESVDDADRYLDAQLEKLQTDQIDFYLIHALQALRWPIMKRYKLYEWGQKAKEDGRIKYLGFSFHDTAELFREIVDAFDWDFTQIQYNYLNEEVQAGTEGLIHAAKKGLGMVIMEPLWGGTLAKFSDSINAIWQNSERTPVDMALQWLWDKPQVSTVLSGMSTMQQVKENVESAENSGVGILTAEEHNIIAKVQHEYGKLNTIPCTKCGYCVPCPEGVDIPRNFEFYNNLMIYSGNAANQGKALYNNDMPAAARADACIACGECEEKCPQKIKISEWMPTVHEALAEA